MIENFLLGLFRAEFLTNWLFFRGGVGVSYLEDGERAADLECNSTDIFVGPESDPEPGPSHV